MDMMLIACELVIAVCTLVYLFSLQHSVDSESQTRRKDMVFGFLSLACTLGVLAVTAIGADKLARGARAAWTRVSETSAGSVSVFGRVRRRSHFGTSVGVMPVCGAEAIDNQEARDEVVA